jgi:hypothetical protein
MDYFPARTCAADLAVERAFFDAEALVSRFSAWVVARERLADGFFELPARSKSRSAFRRGRFRGLAFFWRRQFHTCPSGFRQADSDGLFRGAGAMFAFSNVLDFFADKVPGLRARRLSLPSIFASPLDGFLLRHGSLKTIALPLHHGRVRNLSRN